jgi:[acyl-carrier-protein] S-malonyltransferase
VIATKLGRPALALGHSLGEYSAYVAAGALEATSAARLVRRRGELMLEAGKKRPGAMAAVLALDPALVVEACAEATRDGEVAVAANLNEPGQTVISGDPAAVERAGEGCKARGAKRVILLKVSGAFHSPLMTPAVSGLRDALAGTAFRDPKFPVIANATAHPVTVAADATRLLADQLTAAVRWTDSVKSAAQQAPGASWIEMGPGAVLSGLLKKIVPGASATTLGTADEVQKFLEA